MNIKGVATIVADLGNSETRVKVYYGKDVSGHLRSNLSILSNRYCTILDEAKFSRVMENSEYNSKNSRIFNMGADTYCTGKMCDIEFATSTFRPTAKEKKYESLSTEVTLRNIFLQGVQSVASLASCKPEEVDVDWNIILELPPQDLDLGAKPLAEMVKNVTSIDFIMPKLQKEIRVKKVQVLPEGFCALIGTIFKSYGVPRQEYMPLLKDGVYTMICDIGAGTTDLNIAIGGKVISNSRYSEPIGGNNVQQIVTQKLRSVKNIRVKPAKIQKACETGYLELGADVIPIIDEINTAKREVAVQIVNCIKDYMEMGIAEIQDISYLLVCGGGAESPDVEGIVPMSKYLIDFLENQTTHLKLVELPDVIVNGKKQKLSPRLLNIIGAGILAEGMMASNEN